MARNFTADTRVVVQRTVIVSTEHTLGDLATMTGEDLDDVLWSFNNASGNAWVQDYHVAEMVPYFDRSSTADGDTLDVDSWAAIIPPTGRRA